TFRAIGVVYLWSIVPCVDVRGFGDRFHTVDSRRYALVELVEEAVAEGTAARDDLVCGLAREQDLSEWRDDAGPTNIDGANANIYAWLGCPPELVRGLFVLSRSAGILAHAW